MSTTALYSGRRRDLILDRPSLATRDCGLWSTDLDPWAMPEAVGPWIVFRVAPQAEAVTAYAMRKRGFAAWVPFETRWIRASRYNRAKKREVRRAALPGYILASVADLQPETWVRLLDLENVLGVLGRDGMPLAVPARQVAILARRTAVQRGAEFFDLGERVEVLAGPFSRVCGTVQALDAATGAAMVEVEVFGRATPLRTSVANLVAAQ